MRQNPEILAAQGLFRRTYGATRVRQCDTWR
nr:MAG TPA: hypothetical protein [Caudoviricetes sp.]